MSIDIADKLCVVGIPPVFGRMLPRHLALDLHAVKLLVENDGFQHLIVLQNERQVPQRVLQVSRFVVGEVFLPVGGDGKIIRRLRHALLCKESLNVSVLQCHVRHRLV